MDRRWGVCTIVSQSSKGWCSHQHKWSKFRESGDSSVNMENKRHTKMQKVRKKQEEGDRKETEWKRCRRRGGEDDVMWEVFSCLVVCVILQLVSVS